MKEILFAVLVGDDGTEVSARVTMKFTPDVPAVDAGDPRFIPTQGVAALVDRRINTRLPAGNSGWGGVRGKSAIGAWQFELPVDLVAMVQSGEVIDLLIVVTFDGTKPSWPCDKPCVCPWMTTDSRTY